MNHEQLSVSEHESVSGQLVAGSGSQTSVKLGALLVWALVGVCVVLGIGLGLWKGDNPTGQMAAILAWLPLCLVGVDVCALVFVLWRQSSGLSVVVFAGGGVGHLLAWFWARYLIGFEVFYRLEMTGPLSGVYVVRGGVALLLGLLGVLALLFAVYESLLLVQIVARDNIPVEGIGLTEGDVRLGEGPILEAQVVLHNLGYDVGSIDGVLSPKTQAALEQFQIVSGLAPDGVLARLTLFELRRRGQAYNRVPLSQTAYTLLQHIVKELVAFVQQQWAEVRNR